jgi:hypothetical protein
MYDNNLFMKKTLPLLFIALLLSSCAEKDQFEASVLKQMQADKDLKDYSLDPEDMTSCIMDLTAKKMPGLFPYDPRRKAYYTGLSKLISVMESENPQKTLQEGQEAFPSKKDAMRAMMNYTEAEMDCIASLLAKQEPQ